MLRGQVNARIKATSTKDEILSAMLDWQAYCEFMPHVQSVSIVDASEKNYSLQVEVVTRLPALPRPAKSVLNVEYQFIDGIVKFNQVNGVLKSLKGERRINEVHGGCEITSTVEYEIGFVDHWAETNNSVHSIVERNLASYLKGIKALAAKGSDLEPLTFSAIARGLLGKTFQSKSK